MAISELYVVRHLLQETTRSPQGIIWTEKESEGYCATYNGVSLRLFQIHSSTGTRLWISLAHDLNEIHITEPDRAGLLRGRYKTEDDHQLARSINDLATAVERQCDQRRLAAAASEKATREAIFHRLLFGEPIMKTTGASDPQERERQWL